MNKKCKTCNQYSRLHFTDVEMTSCKECSVGKWANYKQTTNVVARRNNARVDVEDKYYSYVFAKPICLCIGVTNMQDSCSIDKR